MMGPSPGGSLSRLGCVQSVVNRDLTETVGPPQIVQQEFKVTDSYTAPRGTLIMPSITAATMQVLLNRPQETTQAWVVRRRLAEHLRGACAQPFVAPTHPVSSAYAPELQTPGVASKHQRRVIWMPLGAAGLHQRGLFRPGPLQRGPQGGHRARAQLPDLRLRPALLRRPRVRHQPPGARLFRSARTGDACGAERDDGRPSPAQALCAPVPEHVTDLSVSPAGDGSSPLRCPSAVSMGNGRWVTFTAAGELLRTRHTGASKRRSP